MSKRIVLLALLALAILPSFRIFAQGNSDIPLENVHWDLGSFPTFEEVVAAYQPWLESGDIVILDAREQSLENWPLMAQIPLYAEAHGEDLDAMLEFVSTPEGFDMAVVPAGEVWVVETSLDPEVFLPAYSPVVRFVVQEDGSLFKYSYSETLTMSYIVADEVDQVWENPSAGCDTTFDGELRQLIGDGFDLENISVIDGPTHLGIRAVRYEEDGTLIDSGISIYRFDDDGCLTSTD
jgi:hypothetical protein